jgi:hypothetical protein
MNFLSMIFIIYLLISSPLYVFLVMIKRKIKDMNSIEKKERNVINKRDIFL